ncbi:MAG: DUF6701 domain-containing protein, partial [Pseudomonadota bacterium]
FTLSADTATVGYNGTPKLNADLVSDVLSPLSPSTLHLLTGSFSAASSGTGKASGTAFQYGEVGYVSLAANAVYDDTYADINASDISGGDCLSGNTANTKTSGKYGCNVGSSDASSWGRFIPDHFDLTDGGIDALGGYSYMDQPFSLGFTLIAKNANGGVTANYATANGYAKLAVDTANWLSTGLGTPSSLGLGAKNETTDLSSRLTVNGTPTGSWTDGRANVSASLTFSRPATITPDATWGPYEALDVGVAPQDAEGVTLATAALNLDADDNSTCERQSMDNKTQQRFGRLWLGNAYGSEKLDLTLPYELQYWNGQTFIKNPDDGLTHFTESNLSLAHYQGGLSATNLDTSHIRVNPISRGAGTLTVTKPSGAVTGSVDLFVNLGSTGSPANCPGYPSGTSVDHIYLSGNWCGGSYNRDPVSRVTFGIQGSNLKKGLLYLRENF